jgi:hypothetical protein
LTNPNIYITKLLIFIMTFTKEDLTILKALVEQEMASVKKDGERLNIVNSPALSSIYRMRENDIPFLKTETLYLEFLGELNKKF